MQRINRTPPPCGGSPARRAGIRVPGWDGLAVSSDHGAFGWAIVAPAAIDFQPQHTNHLPSLRSTTNYRLLKK